MTSLGRNPIVRWGISFGCLPPDTLSSSSSSCLPLFLQVWQTLTSELTLDGWHSSPKVPELSETRLCLLSSHMASTRSFSASAHLNVMLDTYSEGCVPLAPTDIGLNTTVACRVYSSDHCLHSFLCLPSSRDGP